MNFFKKIKQKVKQAIQNNSLTNQLETMAFHMKQVLELIRQNDETSRKKAYIIFQGQAEYWKLAAKKCEANGFGEHADEYFSRANDLCRWQLLVENGSFTEKDFEEIKEYISVLEQELALLKK